MLDRLAVPIVLAPLAGGPSTPELAAAVGEAGGLGFLAAGYLATDELERRWAATRALTDEPLGINLFVPGSVRATPEALASYLERFRGPACASGVEPGEPRWTDDEWEAKLAFVARAAPEVISFTFGCPDPTIIDDLRRVGSEVWVTVTTSAEARSAAAAGADGLVVQGAEAGGHQAAFVDTEGIEPVGLLALLAAVRAAVDLPLVAAGGIGGGAGLAAALCAGASACQLGTAFLLAPEAGTSPAHRRALAGDAPTALTRAFTGRLARGIQNRFMLEMRDAPAAYPELHYITAPLRADARARDDAELINLWAGESYHLTRERPAAETVRVIAGEARAALRRADARWNG